MRLTAEIATQLVSRIEAFHAEIEKIYDEVRGYDGNGNDSVIADAVAARKQQREAGQTAAALLGSFDFNDAGERASPPPRSAWQAMSARMHETLAAMPESKTRSHLVKQVGIIDKLDALMRERGLPVVTEAEFERTLNP